MEYWITNNDMNIWKVIQNGNNLKTTGRGSDRGLIILPPTTAEEHLAIQRESKARTTLLQSIPDDQIFITWMMHGIYGMHETEGFHKGYDRIKKILSQLNQLNAKPDTEEINLRGYNTFSPSQSVGPSHTAFPEQQLAYEYLEHIEKLDLEEMDLKWKMAMLSVRVHRFEQKARRKIDFDKKESTRSKGRNDKQRYSSFKNKEIGKKEEDLKALVSIDTLVDWPNHDSESDEVITAKEFGMIAGCDSTNAFKAGAIKLYNLINGSNSEEANTPGDARKFALMGVTSEKELGWDDSAFSVFTTTSEDVEGRPTFYRFSKTDSMKAVLPPLTRDYTSLSDHTDLDELQMSYGTKSSTSNDSESVANDFVSCDDSDNSLKVKTSDFASSDSSGKSSEYKPTDFTSCASTSSVSTSVNEAEIESNVGTSIKDSIIVQDLPSFTCNSSDKNEHTSRTSCNKNGYFNKKAGHFRNNALSVSKLCFVCGSGTHLIKDCDFYEKHMANTTIGLGVDPAVRPQPVPTGKPMVKPVPTGKPKVPLVPTGRPKVKPVPT
nr:xylulose kinase-1 [Tanacetum cinerariifolium]